MLVFMNDWKHCSDDKSYNLITKQHGADMAIVRIVNYVFFSQKLHHIYIKHSLQEGYASR